jgi:hypothetical protein
MWEEGDPLLSLGALALLESGWGTQGLDTRSSRLHAHGNLTTSALSERTLVGSEIHARARPLWIESREGCPAKRASLPLPLSLAMAMRPT